MDENTLQAQLGGAAVQPGEGGTAANPGNGPPAYGDRPGHAASVYTDRDAGREVIVSCLRQGLERDERCHHIAGRTEREPIEEALRATGIDVDHALETGALSMQEPAEAYLGPDGFSPERVLERVEDMLVAAAEDAAYAGFRWTGDMGWMLEEDVSAERVMAYEARLNAIHDATDGLFLCEYDRTRFPQPVLSDVIRTHPFVIYDGVVCRNVHYYPPEEFAATERPPLDVDRVARAAVEHARLVAENRAYRQELAARDGRYRTLVDHFPNGAVGLFDADLRFTAAGGQLLETLFDDADDPVGEPVLEYCPPSEMDRIEASLRAALDGAKRSCELDVLGRHLLAQAVPVETPVGEPPSGMIVVLDLTEREEYERKLEEARERVEQFASALSHDLREPLRAISSYLRLIERRYEGELDENADEFIAFAVDGAERMRGIIEGLAAEYARFDRADEPMEPVDLEAVVEDVLSDLHRKIDESEADITVEELPRVRGNACQLNQLFANLLDNAIKYAGDGPPEIHVCAEREGEMCTVAVSDRGIGMDPAEAESAFEMFSRLHEDGAPGAGIGLALCRRIVDRHGGTIDVDSTPGEGSVFSVTLPAAESD